MAVALKELDHWVDGRGDVELRDIGHAIKARLVPKGYGWFSQRTLSTLILRRGTGRTMERLAELGQMNELFYVTARGRGQGKGRTLIWTRGASFREVLRELNEGKMPLAAIHSAERIFQRIFALREARGIARRKNVAHGQRHRDPDKPDLSREGRALPARPSNLATHDPPGGVFHSPPVSLAPRRYTPLARHGEAMRRLKAERDAARRLHEP